MGGGVEVGGERHHHQHRQGSIAPSMIFFTVLAFHYASTWINLYKKNGSDKDKDIKLRGEIKQLLKEASTLSQPSTFAQAAKLRRVAAAKERELTKCQQLHNKDTAAYSKILFVTKVVTYLILLLWFWSVPVAITSQQLLQPFGRLLSWRTGGVQNNDLMIGIIPWLILSTRVSKFICKLTLTYSNSSK